MQDRVLLEKNRALVTKYNRRRSFRNLFQLPLTTRTASYVSLEGTKAIGFIPADIVREIAEFLPPSDILSFSLTSSLLRLLLLPALYDTVVLKSSRSCRSALGMLQKRSHLCQYVRKLAVRPNYYLSWPQPDEELEEDWVVDQLVGIMSHFTGLTTFDWDGLELPNDRLWEELRLKCLSLKSIFTNIGCKPLPHNTSLFKFKNLTSFSLIVRHGLAGGELFPPLEDLPEAFWDMILNRCPDLEELAICSFSSSSRIFDFGRITEGSWPSLHSITLGAFGYQSDFTLGPSSLSTEALSQFLNNHPSLKYIRFLWNFKRWMSPNTIPLYLSSDALPKLDTFIGVYQQLEGLPNRKSLETADLTGEPIYESRLASLSHILLSLTNLTSLDIWVHVFDPNRDHTHFFSSIISSCPNLTDFHFMCTTSFTTQPLKQLITQLRFLPNLKRFSLTKGHKYLDKSMIDTALRIIKVNQGLKQINIRWARESCSNHLKQDGTYDVLFDNEGRPNGFMVLERGIPLVGPAFRRRFKRPFNLDPAEEWPRSVARTTKVVRKRISTILSI